MKKIPTHLLLSDQLHLRYNWFKNLKIDWLRLGLLNLYLLAKNQVDSSILTFDIFDSGIL